MTTLALGTAQFGQVYGVTNAAGALSAEGVRAIVARARELDIGLFDTAHLYGNSEALLGECIAGWPEARVVTKTPGFGGRTIQASDVDALETAFRSSLLRLRRKSLYALLAHSGRDLLAPGGELLYGRLRSLRSAGLVERIGASIYDGAELEALTARYELDVVQLPANVFDQRLLASGWPGRLRGLGVELHLRSVFLQGLLLARPDRLSAAFRGWTPKLVALRQAFADAGLSPIEGALAFAVREMRPDHIVVGVTSVDELEEAAAAFRRACAAEFDFRRFAVNDPALVDPRRWPAGVKAVA